MRARILGLLCALAASPLSAQNAQDFDTYRVRYSAIPTDQLLPDVARSYGIDRSRQRGFLNIAVQKNAPGSDFHGEQNGQLAQEILELFAVQCSGYPVTQVFSRTDANFPTWNTQKDSP